MALTNVFGWNEAAAACGTACGAGDNKPEKEIPSACGTACGAGDDKPEEKPTSACGV